MEKEYTWHKIADHINELNFSNNNIAIVQVKNKKICIGIYKDSVFAFAYKCPHAGGVMADGYIDALGNVVCPLHRYKFSLVSGRNTSGEGYYLKNWPVQIRKDEVYVGLENSSGFFSLFG
jgi:nitrite reductase/ring-hydroxylating ferredoxin subunit